MARQKSVLKLEGRIGDIIFYQSPHGFFARGKGSLDAKRIANDPVFEGSRNSGREFGTAAKSGKLLRQALGVMEYVADNKMVGRLTKRMLEVIQSDVINVHGCRNVVDGEIALLEGFEFNDNGHLETLLHSPFTTHINRVEGSLTVVIPGFIPAHTIMAPLGCSHFRIITSGAGIDFKGSNFVRDRNHSPFLHWNDIAIGDIILVTTLTANSSHPLLFALGIEFYEEVEGVLHSLNKGGFNALGLVKVVR